MRAPLAELSWIDPGQRPRTHRVVTLPGGDRHITLAFTYAEADIAGAVVTARQATLTTAAAEVTGTTAGVSLSGRVRVTDDPNGERFVADLLAAELAKHPPARARADSVLLRSEHWWYLPRRIVTVEAEEVATLGAADALVAVAGGGPVPAVTAIVLPAPADHSDVDTLEVGVPHLPDGAATVLCHGAELPDLERTWSTTWTGDVRAGVLRARRTGGERRAGGPRRLLSRWARERQLERACRAGLRAAGHG